MDQVAKIDRDIDEICDRFESSWKEGGQPRIEDFLDKIDPIHQNRLFEELLSLEMEFERTRGEAPSWEEYKNRFPDRQDVLNRFFKSEFLGNFTTQDQNDSVNGPVDQWAEAPPSFPGLTLISRLGRGGMGTVYKAWQKNLQRYVALKATNFVDDESLKRFRMEAGSIARLKHQNIVQIFDFGEHAGRPFFIMEFVEGGTLAQRIAGRPISPWDAAILVETLARAVHFAHTNKLVHRDLKPSNILLTQDDIPKISDFGLVKLMDVAGDATVSGRILGTPHYMAPEQSNGENRSIGPTTDIYALGAILYELLTGRPPYQGSSTAEVLLLVREKEPLSPRKLRYRLARDLETICLKCLEKPQRNRYQTAEELADELRRYREKRPIVARPHGVFYVILRIAARRPLTSLLSLISLMSTIFLIMISIWFGLEKWRDNQRLSDALLREQSSRAALERVLLVSDIRLASRQWVDGDTQSAFDLLSSTRKHTADSRQSSFPRKFLQRCFAGGEAVIFMQSHVPIKSLRYSSDGRWLGAIDPDGVVSLYTTDQRQKVVLRDTDPAVAIGFPEQMDVVHIAYANGDIETRNLATGQRTIRKFYRNTKVHSIDPVLSSDGRRLAFAERLPKRKNVVVASWRLEFHDLETNKAWTKTITDETDSPLRILAEAGEQGRWLVGRERSAILFGPRAEDGSQEIPIDSNMTSIAVGSGSRVAIGDMGGSIAIWNAKGERLYAFHAHNGPVRSLVFSRDASLLASAGDQPILRLWDLGEGKLIQQIKGLRNQIVDLAFEPNQTAIATASRDDCLFIWKIGLNQNFLALRNSAPPAGPPAFSPNGLILALPYSDRTVGLWNMRTRKASPSPIVCTSRSRRVAISPDGLTLATAHDDGRVELWNLSNTRKIADFEAHPKGVNCLVFLSADSLATGGRDGEIKIWRINDITLRMSLKDHRGELSDLVLSSDKTRLVSGSRDGTVRVWDTATLKSIGGAPLAHDSPVTALSLLKGDTIVAVGQERGGIVLWSLRDRCKLKPLDQMPEWTIRSLKSLLNGSRLVAMGDSNLARFWSIPDGAVSENLWFAAGTFQGSGIDSNGRLMAYATREGRIDLIDTQNWNLDRSLAQTLSSPIALANLADGKTFAILTKGRALTLDRFPQGFPFLSSNSFSRRFIAKSRNGQILLADFESGTVRSAFQGNDTIELGSMASNGIGPLWAGGEGGSIWKVDFDDPSPRPSFFINDDLKRYFLGIRLSSKITSVMPIFHSNIESLAISKNGERMAALTAEGLLSIWNISSSHPQPILTRRLSHAAKLEFSPDSKTLMAVVENHIEFVDFDRAAAWNRVRPWHNDRIRCASFSPTGRWLATAGDDQMIMLWSLDNKDKSSASLVGHSDRIAAIAWSPDGKLLASGSRDGRIKLWDPITFQEWMTLEGHQGRINDLLFSVDGTCLASAAELNDSSGEVLVWTANPRVLKSKSSRSSRSIDAP